MTKKVLFFFPLNPVDSNAGSVTRALSLLNYFKDRNFTVDFMYSNDDWGGLISEKDIQKMKDEGLAQRFFGLSKKPHMKFFFTYLRYAIPNLFLRKLLKVGTDTLVNYNNSHRRSLFNQVVKRGNYGYILISYAYWAKLIENNPYVKDTKLIIDTHDFLTSQDQQRRRFNIGKGFAEEIKRLNLFDEIWTISSDEEYIYNQFCTKPVRLVPICFVPKFEVATKFENFTYDLIYVAGDNIHNIKSSNWFFEKVYPLLPDNLRICTVGKINHFIPDKPNISKIYYAENLDNYYESSKIAICPMLSGTGVKIKVIEALSFGLPVICTPRGIDGLINKKKNGCLVAEDASMFATNIIQLLENKERYCFYKNEAINFFVENHSKDAVYHVIDRFFE